MTAQVHVLVFDGFADWEPAYALAELRRRGHYEVIAVGFDDETVTSMGCVSIPTARYAMCALRMY